MSVWLLAVASRTSPPKYSGSNGPLDVYMWMLWSKSRIAGKACGVKDVFDDLGPELRRPSGKVLEARVNFCSGWDDR